MILSFHSILAILMPFGMAQAAGLRSKLYIPKPAGPKITGTLKVASQSSEVPRYGGWIKFKVELEGIPENGILPNGSKITINTFCEQDFHNTVDMTQEYDGSGMYTFYLKDGELNLGSEKPWKENEYALCQTKLVYQYKYEDFDRRPSKIEYILSHTRVYNVDGMSDQESATFVS